MIQLPIAGSRETYTVNPSKIIALGQNYRAHIAESSSLKVRGFEPEPPSEPVLFPKAPSCLIGPGETIVIPAFLSEYGGELRTDLEGELAFFIRDRCKNVPPEEAYGHILGFCCLNDVSQRNLQNGDRAGWFRGKSLDTFGPVGPVLVPPADLSEPQNLRIVTRLNGKVVQEGNTRDKLFSIREMIAFISKCFTLMPGDLIATGTPSGVTPLAHGDVCEVEIEGIGILSNPVRVEVK
jgi:2-keto-4-pentenoate hydratase/2-oxohepta-3-ene-1,7-dioic acid hydratase in catechol pathway